MERQKIIETFGEKLASAIGKGDFQKVKECIEEIEHKQIKNEVLNYEKYYMKPIHHATLLGNLKVLRFLCKNGADVNTTISDQYLSTPLHIAARHNRLEIAKFLLDSCANINAKNYQGCTPLYLASNDCHLDMVKLLLCRGADASIQSRYGKTALNVVGDARKDECSSSEIQKIESVLSNATEADCEAELTSIKVVIKDDNDSTDLVSSAASLQLSPTKAIKIELEVSNTEGSSSSTVNSFSTSTRADFKEASSITSGAVKPSSFINSIFSWVTTATLSDLFSSAPALPPAEQSVDHLDCSPIGSSQVDFNGTALLTDVMIRKFTGKKYSSPLEDSLLTIQEIRERKLNTIEKNFETALSKCEKFYKCPENSLSNLTISKGVCHQKSL
ncbi:ankyrin repeat domain-containing protein [Wolbachia endosymbiont of Anopheles demeilloni]|uniref:ankyrin repeat domain-containing protein n=1 Tax=Wolbachia endosymbiont of Anopheles demeilloni TaxID=2748871 RepID=UPI001BDB1076|nr:ankyrin repeat domain-containing protein [Wolbachia endosymbiont of Anopheles demeilloni]UIP92305.1 ankyrin repeat domain-containing protein [Wolbachia endosymbiont of Anopheles demeilloni]